MLPVAIKRPYFHFSFHFIFHFIFKTLQHDEKTRNVGIVGKETNINSC